MKQMFLSFGLLLFILSASAQEKITLQRERESFDGSDWAWSSRVNQDIYNCYITDQGNYLLSLPPGSWGFTFAALPAQLKTIEKLRNGELNFDFKIKSMYDDRFSIGLLFDFYGATDQCLGGNFYNLRIYGSNDVISASIEQRKDCAYVPKATVASTGSAKINLKGYNHVSIKKNGVRYEVFINEVRVLVFEYTGAINFARLYWERGEYFLDNFVVNETIYSTTPPASSVVSATPTDQARPKLYVLSIGINVYDSGLNPQRTLNGCVNDAVAMRNFYTGVGGGAVEIENIALLTNSRATINNILASANRIFSKAGSNDVIITFLSGHGGVGAFCAYDGDLPYERINQIINKSAASKLCIVDACHAGSWNVNSV